MRILLARACDPDINIFSNCPPLGILYLAGALRKRAPHHQVQIVDTMLRGIRPDDLVEQIRRERPDLVGLSVTTYDSLATHRIAKGMRERAPGIPLVVGGPYPTGQPDEVLADPNIDYVITGEGEETFADLVETLERGGDVATVAGLGWNRDGESRFNCARPAVDDPDTIPFPAWDLIDLPEYFRKPRFQLLYAKKEYMPIYTSRGCPYKCTFCHLMMGKEFRPRSVGNVLEEIRTLHDVHGVREFLVVDDIFNMELDRAKAICDAIVGAGLTDIRLSFPCGLRGDRMDTELLEKLRPLVYRLHYAVESGSPRIQKLVKKYLKLERLLEVVDETDRLGILTQGFFLFGFPTETREEIEQTIDYALESRFHTAQFMSVKAFPGTPIHDLAREEGVDLSYDPNQYAYIRADKPLNGMSSEEMGKIIQRAYRRFYFDSWRISRNLIRHPRKRQIFELIPMFLRRAYLSSYAATHGGVA
ncbi:MAG: cobalamin B12-binding domain-containing protein [Planctomycetes bacterium]|nr:cobalamin B12-binding domain-containing protein [Planctomycetota bacterium]MBI3848498.1 cobalamin B12-binding domain-containing protein [Planctomycetota bacterium]